MSYRKALEAAGAIVHEFGEFGCYQGDWWAKVSYNGKIGWVHGYYGSCSGCDSFQSEFGDCDEDEQSDAYKKRLCDFGLIYLENIITQEEAENVVSKNIEWDIEAQEALDFIKQNPVLYLQ